MKPIPVSEPLMEGSELARLEQCIDSGWLSSEGDYVKQFEKSFSGIVDREYGIAVSNGSAALDIAVAALDLGPGDEVVVPAFCIISCVASIVRSGATPVLVDVDPVTWNVNPADVEKSITQNTRAIMVVHTYGLPVDMEPVLKLAKEKNLFIIEDAAEMHGQTYKGKPCGSFGDISTFSFYSNKHITTGEGGMLVTNNPDLAERCRQLRNLCFNEKQRFVHDCLGWNYRLSNLQAAVGVAQIAQLETVIAKKREIGAMYQDLLSDIDGIQLPLPRTDFADNIYWVFGIVLSEGKEMTGNDLSERLRERKIGSRPFFWPMHKQPVFKKMGLFKNDVHPVSERLATNGIYIPCSAVLNRKQVQRVSDTLHDILV
jgi:perosamine synthetase